MSGEKINVGILLSGTGTNARAIIDASRSMILPVNVSCIISSDAKAPGFRRAEDLGFIPGYNLFVVNPSRFINEDEFSSALLRPLKNCNVEVVTQSGWLPKTPVAVISEFTDMIYNQHVGPLRRGQRDFGGMYGLARQHSRIEFVKATNRDWWTEVVVHKVTEKWDDGPVIKLQQVPIEKNDTPESLNERTLPVEYEVIIAALQDIAAGNVTEVVHEVPILVRDDEVDLWRRVRKEAREKYPLAT